MAKKNNLPREKERNDSVSVHSGVAMPHRVLDQMPIITNVLIAMKLKMIG
jgi:hypothetical protein